MRRNAATLFVALCLAGAGLVFAGCESSEEGPTKITLLSRAPERGNWSPQTIRVVAGRQVTLTIRNVDVVTHSFFLPAFGISTGPIKPGETRQVTFTPEEQGEYLFTCGIWCSDYHMYERGTLIVQ